MFSSPIDTDSGIQDEFEEWKPNDRFQEITFSFKLWEKLSKEEKKQYVEVMYQKAALARNKALIQVAVALLVTAVVLPALLLLGCVYTVVPIVVAPDILTYPLSAFLITSGIYVLVKVTRKIYVYFHKKIRLHLKDFKKFETFAKRIT